MAATIPMRESHSVICAIMQVAHTFIKNATKLPTHTMFDNQIDESVFSAAMLLIVDGTMPPTPIKEVTLDGLVDQVNGLLTMITVPLDNGWTVKGIQTKCAFSSDKAYDFLRACRLLAVMELTLTQLNPR